MRLLFVGDHLPAFEAFKHLLLVADELAFLDRPSVSINNFGTIGRGHDFRRFSTEDSPVQMHALSPPSEASDLFREYAGADASNADFVACFLEGLRNSERFRTLHLPPKANYGSDAGTGADVAKALLEDPKIVTNATAKPVGHARPYTLGSEESRAETLRELVVDASIQVTNALVQSQQTGLAPVSDEPYTARLLAMRSTDRQYVREAQPVAAQLAIAVAQSVIPVEVVKQLSVGDIFDYRKKSRDAYRAWSEEIDRLASQIEGVSPDKAEQQINKIIRTDIRPRLTQYRNEMISTRDQLFAELLKKVVPLEVPTLALTQLAGISPTQALMAFAASLAPAVPPLVDFIAKREDARRRNSLSYLIGIHPDLG